MTAISKEAILKAIRDMLVRLGKSDPGLEQASYVLESHVSNELPLSVSRQHLISSEQFGDLTDFLEGGADWIHANLYVTPDGQPVIGLSRGKLCGNPQPSLNVSIDSQPLHII